ncbi:hypothetical protein Cabys_2146 [Caldithrix abyssi DSM 13497]|uniref:Uncharacterized protein n=1 Tax=Caldithrix abyssi DSM 13497 TaxID=880073 RepID=A0A1J1C8C0_CALAY|nr:hypothetical protein Cabys_2146 [Caldithrix abyssi DSM 13497]
MLTKKVGSESTLLIVLFFMDGYVFCFLRPIPAFLRKVLNFDHTAGFIKFSRCT